MVEATPTERLREGLSRARSAANDATMASFLIRPDQHAERVREALARIREALNVATEALGEALTPPDRGDGMDRRGLLRALSTTAATAVLPPGSLERLVEVAQALGRSRRVDGGLLDRLEDVNSSLAQRFYASRPEELTGAVRGLADMLTRLLGDGTMEPGQRTRLATLGADVHLFAGQLAVDMDLRTDARAYFRLARDLAREAGDGVLHALALHNDAYLHALRTPAGERGDPQRAVWQMGQAAGGLPAGAPAAVRAYMGVSLARHLSMTGDVYGFQGGIVRGADDVERARLGEDAGARGFTSQDGWLSVVTDANWLADYEGRGLASLGRDREAADLLSGALAADTNPQRHSAMLINLASAHAADEPEQAATVAVEAFDVAKRAGYAAAYPALDAVRAKLAPDVPGVRELDERLATV